MKADFTASADALLEHLTTGEPRLPRIVAMLTDRDGNVYERAVGRRLDSSDAAMTPTASSRSIRRPRR